MEEFNLRNCGEPTIICHKNQFWSSKMDKELVFDVEMSIIELYASENKIISKEKWIDCNVVLTQ